MSSIKELMNLKGRRALVTGAVGGIGQQIALTIAELGGDLLLVDIPNSNYELIKEKILPFALFISTWSPTENG